MKALIRSIVVCFFEYLIKQAKPELQFFEIKARCLGSILGGPRRASPSSSLSSSNLAIHVKCLVMLSEGTLCRVLLILIALPFLLSLLLLAGNLLVDLLKLLHHCGLLASCFILEHAAHASDCLGL